MSQIHNPKVTVLLSVFNGEKFLHEAIESVLNQTFKDFEFLIINDGSNDSSLDVILSYNDPRVRLIENKRNIGLTRSLNKGLKLAKGQYIARMDSDDISMPNRFDEQIRYFKKHPDVAVLGTSAYRIDENSKIIGKLISLVNPDKKLFEQNQLSHGSVMFEKKVINSLGGYDELFRYSQDYELWLRVAQRNKVRNLNQILYKSRSHSENMWFKNKGESALYGLLASKKARKDLDPSVLTLIEQNGISNLFPYLNKREKIFFYKALASIHIHNNDLKNARSEYKKVFNLNPLDAQNNINILRTFLTKEIITWTSKIYDRFMNILKNLKNHFIVFFCIFQQWP